MILAMSSEEQSAKQDSSLEAKNILNSTSLIKYPIN